MKKYKEGYSACENKLKVWYKICQLVFALNFQENRIWTPLIKNCPSVHMY